MTAPGRVSQTLNAQPVSDTELPRFNPARMNEIAQQAGSDDIVYELVGLFGTDVSARLEDLAKAVLAADKEWRERVAHSIKGSCANLGAERMANMAARIERCAEAAADAEVRRIQAEFNELCLELGALYPPR